MAAIVKKAKKPKKPKKENRPEEGLLFAL